MALSMDEQRMLAEIERRLAAEDPGLATRLSSFRRRSGPAAGLRTPRGRVILLVGMLSLIAVLSAVVYLLAPFRPAKAPSTPLTSHPAVIVQGNDHPAP
jgi:Protein of unknown function (DUF3040)